MISYQDTQRIIGKGFLLRALKIKERDLKRMKKNRFILPVTIFALLISFGLSACNNDNGGGKVSSTQVQEKITVKAEGNKTKLILGEKVQLNASVEGVTWTSKKPEVATVDANGLVTSVAVGTASIAASKDGYKEGTISINVDLETITITAAGEKSIVIGTTLQLTASQQGVSWSSSNEAIASVDQTGKVTGNKFGSATITAAKDGFNPGKVEVTVTRPAPTAVLDMKDAEHYAADGEWSSSNDPTESPLYDKNNAPDGQCLAHFGGGDIETMRFSSSKAVKAELVLTIGYYYTIDDLTTVYDVKFNNAVVNFEAQGYEAEDTSNYTFKGLSFGELDLIAGTNVLEIAMKEDASRIPYMDNLEIYAAEATEIAVVAAPQKDPVVVNEASITVAEGKTAAITSSMTGLSYKSASTSIATVDENGIVSGVKVGETTISVSKEGYKTIRVPVTVTEAEGVIAVGIQEGTSEGDVVTFRESRNLEAPYNNIVDAWPVDAVLTIKVNNTGAAGAFNMYVRCRASGGYQSSSSDDLATCMEVKVNGNAVAASGTVSGNSFTDYLLGEVNLTAGENTITIKCLTTVPTMNLLRFIPKTAA